MELTERQHANNIHAAFKAGVQFQKEQDVPIIDNLIGELERLKAELQCAKEFITEITTRG